MILIVDKLVKISSHIGNEAKLNLGAECYTLEFRCLNFDRQSLTFDSKAKSPARLIMAEKVYKNAMTSWHFKDLVLMVNMLASDCCRSTKGGGRRLFSCVPSSLLSFGRG